MARNTAARQAAAAAFGRPALPGTLVGTYEFPVDYDRPVEVHNTPDRRWTYFSDSITAVNFPPRRRGVHQAVMELIEFDGPMTGLEAEAALAARGLTLPDMYYQVSFDQKQPSAWAGKLVVFSGAVVVDRHGGRSVGVLGGLDGSRGCGLFWVGPDSQWGAGSLFAGVRK